MQNIYYNTRVLQLLTLTETDIRIINLIEYAIQDQTWLIRKIRYYATNFYPVAILLENYTAIRNLGRDSSSLQSFIIRYGAKLGSELFKIKNNKTRVSRSMLEDRHGKKTADAILSLRGASLENYITRHGRITGKKKWNAYLSKRADTYAQKKKEGYVFPSMNLAYYVELHGKVKGTAIYTRKINTQRYKVSKAYYIDQFGPIIGPIKCKECKDHSSLSYFVTKYGPKIGNEKYRARCLKIAVSSSKITYSKMSSELFDKIKGRIPDLFYYGPNEMTWGVSKEYNIPQKVICPDLFYKGKIIEFNGDVFHANPAKFEATDCPHPFRKDLTASEIWSIDAHRYAYYEKKEYNLLVVWEADYVTNPERIILECQKFLTS